MVPLYVLFVLALWVFPQSMVVQGTFGSVAVFAPAIAAMVVLTDGGESCFGNAERGPALRGAAEQVGLQMINSRLQRQERLGRVNLMTVLISLAVAIAVAERLQVNPDAFLMGVAVAASCAFLTPIGHQSNTLVMGPGGYRFGDYWPMGLPLEILVLLVSVPMILLVWPL